MHTVYQVVGRHNRHRLCRLDCDFKALQIDFTHCTFADVLIDIHTVIFLVVGCKVLDTGSDSGMGLDSSGIGCGAHTCHQRIFRVVLEISSAKRISVNIHARRQPYGNVEFFHLFSDDITAFLDQIHVPRLRKKRCYRDCGAVLEILRAAFRNFDFIFVKRIFQRISGGYHLSVCINDKVRNQTKTGRTVCKNRIVNTSVLKKNGSRISRCSRRHIGRRSDKSFLAKSVCSTIANGSHLFYGQLRYEIF